MTWFKQFFSEADGKASFGRLASFISLVVVLRMAWGTVKLGGGVPDNLEALGIFFLAMTSPYLGGKFADALKTQKG